MKAIVVALIATGLLVPAFAQEHEQDKSKTKKKKTSKKKSAKKKAQEPKAQ